MTDKEKISSYIIKIEENCNLKCSYCYCFSHGHRLRTDKMDLEIIKKLMVNASNFSGKVDLIWHGGEPLLSGTTKFNQILDIQDDIRLEKKTKFRNLIQTNGTLINKKWIKIFRRGKFGISISLDGPPQIHNKYRLYKSGSNSFQDTMRGIDLLKKSEIKFSILSVVTKQSIKNIDEIYNFFIANNIESFDFLPCFDITNNNGPFNNNISSGFLDRGDFSKFIMYIFDLWLSQDNPAIRIRYIEEIIKGLLGNKPSLCKLQGSCFKYVTVNCSGRVLACDNLALNEEFLFGNIQANSLNEIMKSPRRIKYIESLKNIRPECKKCKYVKLCNGGCNRHLNGKNFFCDDVSRIYGHISAVLSREHPNLNSILAMGN